MYCQHLTEVSERTNRVPEQFPGQSLRRKRDGFGFQDLPSITPIRILYGEGRVDGVFSLGDYLYVGVPCLWILLFSGEEL